MTIRHVRPGERFAREIKRTRASVRDAQRPTGTERNGTAETVIDLQENVLPALRNDLDEAGQHLADAVDQLEGKDQELEQGLQDATGAISTAQARADAAFGKAETVEAAVQVAVVATLEEYALADEGAAAPAGGWSTTLPEPAEGQVVWRRLRTIRVDQTESISTPTLLGAGGGGAGEDGVSVLAVEWWYRLDTVQPAAPASVPPAAPWQATEPVPDLDTEQRVWASALTLFSNDTFTWSPPHESAGTAVARTAYARADAALTLAGSKTTVFYSDELPGGTAPEGSVWRRRATAAEIAAGVASEGDIMQEFVNTGGSVWQETKVSSSAIANLDVGKLVVGTGVISDLVADHLAARTAEFMQLGVDKLTVAGEAQIQEAVIEALWADVVVARMLTATEKIVTKDVIATGAILAEHLAAHSLDFMEARGMQLYASYIEAPTIASSDKLGTGANKLNDPTFQGAIGGEWVASGHLGDAPVTQRDTITWDQTWTMPRLYPGVGTQSFRNHASAKADLQLEPGQRATGSLVFANYSWLTKTARSVSNPYTFKSFSEWTFMHGQQGGLIDPSWAEVKARPVLAGTARTTYLTNTAQVAVASGTRWNVRLAFSKLAEAQVPLVSNMAVQVVQAGTSTVLWEHALNADQMKAGLVNEWWECDYTGDVQYRIATTYTAAGGGSDQVIEGDPTITRTATADSWARRREVGGQIAEEWLGSGGFLNVPYGARIGSMQGLNNPDYVLRARFNITAHSAMFAEVEPEKGWRITAEQGLEFFNSLGARTARFDGEENYFSGRMASRETGQRWEIREGFLELYNAANQLLARLYDSGGVLQVASGHVHFAGSTSLASDTGWNSATLASGVTGMARWKREGGLIHLQFDVSSASVPANGQLSPAFTLPPEALLGIASGTRVGIWAIAGGTGAATGGINESNGNAWVRNLHTSALSSFSGSGVWPAE